MLTGTGFRGGAGFAPDVGLVIAVGFEIGVGFEAVVGFKPGVGLEPDVAFLTLLETTADSFLRRIALAKLVSPVVEVSFAEFATCDTAEETFFFPDIAVLDRGTGRGALDMATEVGVPGVEKLEVVVENCWY